jgi:SAM-dependent methyltransferase
LLPNLSKFPKRFLPNYAHRRLLRAAARWIERLRLSDWKIVELGCGNGALASRIVNSRYIGIDGQNKAIQAARRRFRGKRCQFLEADVTRAELPAADLMVFLRLADRLGKADFSHLLSRLPSKRILFSFTESPPDQGRFVAISRRLRAHWQTRRRPVTYRCEEVTELLEKHGFKHCEIRKLPLFIPSRLVFATRQGPHR